MIAAGTNTRSPICIVSPHHAHQIDAQDIQVRLVPELD